MVATKKPTAVSNNSATFTPPKKNLDIALYWQEEIVRRASSPPKQF